MCSPWAVINTSLALPTMIQRCTDDAPTTLRRCTVDVPSEHRRSVRDCVGGGEVLLLCSMNNNSPHKKETKLEHYFTEQKMQHKWKGGKCHELACISSSHLSVCCLHNAAHVLCCGLRSTWQTNSFVSIWRVKGKGCGLRDVLLRIM